MKYKSNRKQVKQALDNAKNNTLEAIGKAGQGYVKLLAPVDSGALRDSISYSVDDNSVLVGSDLVSEDYPVYQEKGTSKQKAQPYIQPGIYDNINALKKIAERNYKL
jgi:HK97 gp10 family phage protein